MQLEFIARHRGIENCKMYTIKQTKICAQYRDMVPKASAGLLGTPGLWPIGFRPGGRLNKKDGLTRYGDSHVKDKTS